MSTALNINPRPLPITHIISKALNSYKRTHLYKCRLNTGKWVDFKTPNSTAPDQVAAELLHKFKLIAIHVRRFSGPQP